MKNKVLMMLLSLLISVGLWLYVVTVISPESETTLYNVPVELVGTSYLDAHDLVLVSDVKNLKMDLKLIGNRSDLSKLNASNVTLIADLSKITGPGEHQVDCSVSYQTGTAKVDEKSLQQITVVVAEQVSKTVPVKIIYTGSVRSGYEADKDAITLDHTTVTVKGPKESVDQIAYAGITVDLSDRMTSFVGNYALTLYGNNSLPMMSDRLVSANVTQVSAVVQVYKVKKINLLYELEYDNSSLREDMVTLTATREVTLVGSDEALAKLDDQFMNGQYTFTLKLRDYKETTTQMLTLPLPDGVSCREEIRAYIQIPKLVSKVLVLESSQFEITGCPEGTNVRLPERVQIVIWCPEEDADNVRAENVRATVDCSGVVIGSNTVSVRYAIDGYDYLCVEQGTQITVIVAEA